MSDSFIQKREELVRTIFEINSDQNKLTRNQLENKYKSFIEKHPKTWLNLMDKKVNMQQFRENSTYYNQQYRHSRGNHNQKRFNADVQFGEKMAKEYLYPKTGKPDPKQMAKAFAMAKAKSENPNNSIPKKENMQKMDI